MRLDWIFNYHVAFSEISLPHCYNICYQKEHLGEREVVSISKGIIVRVWVLAKINTLCVVSKPKIPTVRHPFSSLTILFISSRSSREKQRIVKSWYLYSLKWAIIGSIGPAQRMKGMAFRPVVREYPSSFSLVMIYSDHLTTSLIDFTNDVIRSIDSLTLQNNNNKLYRLTATRLKVQ